MRAAIYARFSSELQDARSITDQLALCVERAAAEHWTIAGRYSDAAISGASVVNRPGLNDMLAAAAAKKFDIILTESLDRLSRDLADISRLWRDLSFLGIRVFTLHEGEVGFMHVGLKGIVGQMFLADLAAKTRRGHVGRLRAGRIPGGRCYGYDVVPGDEKGLRTINEAEAEIVRRIFAAYDAGRSARDIAGELNRDGIAAPSGGHWNGSTINGSAKRASGILQNRLYIGEIVYGRQKFEKNPNTGTRIAKVIGEKEWLVEAAPALAIVDRDVFDRVHLQRRARANGPNERQRRPKHLFSGIVRCGCCSGPMIVTKPGRIGCSFFRNRSTCKNNQTITVKEIMSRVLATLQTHLLAPEIVAEAVEAYRLERERSSADRARASRQAQRDLLAVDAKISRIVRAIEDGTASPALAARLSELEADRQRIAGSSTKEVADNVLALHPSIAGRYKNKVADIHMALEKGDQAGREAVALVRELISAIIVTPESGGGHNVEIEGNLAALLLQPGLRGDDNDRISLPLPTMQMPPNGTLRRHSLPSTSLTQCPTHGICSPTTADLTSASRLNIGRCAAVSQNFPHKPTKRNDANVCRCYERRIQIKHFKIFLITHSADRNQLRRQPVRGFKYFKHDATRTPGNISFRIN